MCKVLKIRTPPNTTSMHWDLKVSINDFFTLQISAKQALNARLSNGYCIPYKRYLIKIQLFSNLHWL